MRCLASGIWGVQADMMKKLDHIGIAVKNIQESLKVYEGILGLSATPFEEVPERGARLVFLKVGDVMLELVEPYQPGEGPVARFLEKRGEGLHHITFEVEDIVSTMQVLSQAGFELADKEPRKGSKGTLTAFVSPRSTHGVLIELKQYI
jgi:methylmalonyl-CoA epimerase